MNDRGFERRPDRDGARKPMRRDNAAPSGRAERFDSSAPRPAWQTRVERPIRDDREKSPLIPEEITPMDLEIGVRAQLKTLTAENADMVARHLAMVALLINEDPELAHKHAVAAAQRAGRIAVVRETLGITAYSTGDFALALRELLTFRRISGSNDQLPLMADSERGLGRPDRALELGRSVDRAKLAPSIRVNLAIAMSGARLDLGDNEMALAELEIPELNASKVFDYSPPLFWAYADTLEILGRDKDAKRWSELAERAEAAILDKKQPNGEVLEVLEEIEIPTAEDRPKRVDRDDRPARGERSSRDYGQRRDEGQRRDDRGPRRDDRGSRDDQPRRTESYDRSAETSSESTAAPDRGFQLDFGDKPRRSERPAGTERSARKDRPGRSAPAAKSDADAPKFDRKRRDDSNG